MKTRMFAGGLAWAAAPDEVEGLSKARLARIKKMYEDGNIELRETDITADEMLKNLVYGSVVK